MIQDKKTKAEPERPALDGACTKVRVRKFLPIKLIIDDLQQFSIAFAPF